MNADGSGLSDVTTSPSDMANGFYEENPAWSPDSTKIAYDSDREEGLYVMNADGSGVTKIARGSNPSWSPDGKRIVFAGKDGLYAVNSDGTGLTRLTSGSADAFPAWSPDGTRIAFVRSPGANATIFVMSVDGSDLIAVGQVLQVTGPPVWSPTGSQLALAGLTNANWDIYVADADGTGFKDLTKSVGRDEQSPVWSPDGTTTAFETTSLLASEAPPDNTAHLTSTR
jgi:Tol biopolymer transport system component